MSRSTALLDANILYSAQMRDIFLQLTRNNLYQARWTNAIQDEWINALLDNEPHLNRAALENLRNIMNSSFRDPLIDGYEHLTEDLTLPDPEDRHILAAAIVADCDVIVTRNLKHFPEKALSPHGIMAQHPDDFLLNLLKVKTNQFCAAVHKIRL